MPRLHSVARQMGPPGRPLAHRSSLRAKNCTGFLTWTMVLIQIPRFLEQKRDQNRQKIHRKIVVHKQGIVMAKRCFHV